MVQPITKIQIGKQGVTENFIQTLKNYFTKHGIIKISVLKSAGHDKEKIKEMAEKIVKELGNKFTYRRIGFTIVLKKWRKARR